MPASRFRSSPWAEGCVVVLATILGLAVFGRAFGPYWDSWYYFHHAEPFSRWLASWWTGESVPPLSDFRAYFPEEDMHPPLMVYGAGFFHAFFHPLLGHLGSCRLIIICFSALWCGAFYLFLRSRVGGMLALSGLALLAGCPRFWVHAVLLNIDGLVASIYGLALLSFRLWDRGWQGKAWIWFILTLGFLTKLQSFYLIPILGVWVAVCSWKARIAEPVASRCQAAFVQCLSAGGVVLLALLAAFLAWPALWIDFPDGLYRYIRFITRHSNVPVLYFGTLYKGDSIPPWHYPWLYTVLALPPLPVLLILSRAVRKAWNRCSGKTHHPSPVDPLLWMGFLTPLLVSSLPFAPKYDEVRLLLPAYGPMFLLAAQELAWWFGCFEEAVKARVRFPYRRLILLGVTVLILLPSIRIYPFNLVYFSPLIGGVSGAREKGFDLEYLGVSMHLLNPTLQKVAREGDVLLLAGCNALVYEKGPEGWPPIPPGLFPVDFKMLREISFEKRSVFAILSSRYGDLGPEAHLVLDKLPALATVAFNGERLFSLHRITPEFVQQLPGELLKQQQQQISEPSQSL